MTGQTLIWVDGERADVLPLPDRGLDFGDGLFETLLLEHGELRYIDLHLQRLQRGLALLSFPDCLSVASKHLQIALTQLQLNNWSRAALRLTVTRGDGPRGYAPPRKPQARIIIRATQLASGDGLLPQAAHLITATTRWGSQPQLAGIKHLNRLEQVLAAAEWQRAGADEALMLGQASQLVSVTAGNLFLHRDGVLYTPALDDCGIAGTRRQLVIEQWAPAIGLQVVVAAGLDQDALEQADEVFYSNTLWGLRPVASCGSRHWHSHPVCNALFQHYSGDQA